MRTSVAAALGLAGFALATPAQAGFDLNRFFLAPTNGAGYIDPIVGPTQRFRVTTRARGSQRRLRMAERFRYRDGTRKLQDWTIRRRGHGYVATRPDLVGPVRFRRAGRASYRYTWRQWFDWPARENLVTVRGRLTLVDGRTVVNRATAFKGIWPVASIRVRFRRAR